MKRENFDIVIVGGGIAGLYAGCFLSKSGYRCAILEAHYVPGGCAHGFRRNGFYFDAGAHLIGSIGPKALLTRLLKEIDVNYSFLPLDPVDRIHFRKITVNVPHGWEKYRDMLGDLFPAERAGLASLFERMEIIARYSGRKDIADKYGPMTYQCLMDQFINSGDLKSILGAQWGFLGEMPDRVSALSMSIMLIGYIRDGAGYSQGGAQRFCNILANKFRAYGGMLYLSTTVENILAKRDSVDCLITNTFKEFRGRHFLWTANPENILSAAVNAETANLIKSIEKSISIYSLFLGLNLPASKFKGLNGWHYAPVDLDNSDTWIYLFSPSYYDNSLAPAGKSSLVLSIICKGVKNVASDDASIKMRREAIRVKIINALSQIVPDVKSKIEVLEDAIPRTFQHFLRSPEGAIYGWAPRADNYFLRESLSKTSIYSNLSISGHWSMPGPGIPAVAMSSYMSCEKIIASLQERRLCDAI